MTTPRSFHERIGDAVIPGLEADFAQIDIERANAARAKRIGHAVVRSREMDRNFEGTRPVDIWGEEGQQICDEFLTYMNEHDFKGSVEMTHKPPLDIPYHHEHLPWHKRKQLKKDRNYIDNQVNQAGKTVRGYQIGFVGESTDVRKPLRSENASVPEKWKYISVHKVQDSGRPREVFLCDDGMVRVVQATGIVERAGDWVTGDEIPMKSDVPDGKGMRRAPKLYAQMTSLPVMTNQSDKREGVPELGQPVLPYIGVKTGVPNPRTGRLEPSFPGAIEYKEAPLQDMLVHLAATTTRGY